MRKLVLLMASSLLTLTLLAPPQSYASESSPFNVELVRANDLLAFQVYDSRSEEPYMERLRISYHLQILHTETGKVEHVSRGTLDIPVSLSPVITPTTYYVDTMLKNSDNSEKRIFITYDIVHTNSFGAAIKYTGLNTAFIN